MRWASVVVLAGCRGVFGLHHDHERTVRRTAAGDEPLGVGTLYVVTR